MTIYIQNDTILNVVLFIIKHGDWRTGASGMGCFYRLLPKYFKFGPTVLERFPPNWGGGGGGGSNSGPLDQFASV